MLKLLEQDVKWHNTIVAALDFSKLFRCKFFQQRALKKSANMLSPSHLNTSYRQVIVKHTGRRLNSTAAEFLYWISIKHKQTESVLKCKYG